MLQKKGFLFQSQTDSEVIAHLLSFELRTNNPKQAIKRLLDI